MASKQADMSPDTARRLAALIVAGAEQLDEKAQQHGVTAFVGQAVQREKPNERFLQSTLRNVASSNRRADERVMWAAWEARKQLQDSSMPAPVGCADSSWCSSRNGRTGRGSRKRSRSRSSSRERGAAARISRRQRSKKDREPQHRDRTKADASAAAASVGNCDGDCSSSHSDSLAEGKSSRSSSTVSSEGRAAAEVVSDQRGPLATGNYADNGSGDDGDDQRLLQWLGSSQKVRGRGAVGPNADMPGPYLEAPSGISPAELQQLDYGTAKGPARPSWMPRDDAEKRRLRPNAGFLQGLLRAQGVVSAAGSGAQRGLGQGAEPGSEARRGDTQRSRSNSGGEGSSGSASSASRVRRRRSKSKKRKHKRKGSSKHKKKHKRRE